MPAELKKFHLPAKLTPFKSKTSEPVTLHVSAINRKAAVAQCRSGILQTNVQKAHPGAVVRFDLRKLRCVRQ